MPSYNFVGVDNECTPAGADPLGAAVAERLAPDSVMPIACLVPVGVVGMPMKPCLQPLEPGTWLIGEKKVRASHSQTFASLCQDRKLLQNKQ